MMDAPPSQTAEQPVEGSLQESMQELAEPQEIKEPQQMPELQETASSRETEDDFFVPEPQNLDAAAESGCACCS